MDYVLSTDTFETWRTRTNAIIDIANNAVTASQVLMLSGNNQIVSNVNTFTAGIRFGNASSGPVILASSDNTQLQITHDVAILNGKSLSASSITASSGLLSLHGNSYSFPSSASEGYLKATGSGTNQYDISFIPTSQIAGDVITQALASIGGNIALVEELVPVGAIVGFRSVSNLIGGTSETKTWLKCDGSPFESLDYPELYAALNNSSTLPDLTDNNTLLGNTTATGSKLGTINTSSGTSYLPVVYYIKARSSKLINFSFLKAANSGITFRDKLTNASLNELGLSTGGGKIGLDVNSTYFAFSGNTLTLNASSSATANTIAVRDSSGNLRSGAYDDQNPNNNIVATVGYVNSLGHREHKFKALNGRGFNSYRAQPLRGAACIDVDDNVLVYGNNGSTNYTRRFGYYDRDAYGHTISTYEGTASAIYADQTNTYVKYANGRVYATGSNYGATSSARGKAGLYDTGSATLKGPRIAFDSNNVSISEIILSYDADAKSAYALTADGKLYTAGDNTYGQLGNSSDGIIGEGNYTVTKAWLIGGGTTQTGYALRSDGTLWACGYGSRGQMGRFMSTALNSKWVPVLNPVSKSWSNLGVSNPSTNITRTDDVYTMPSTSTLKQYDKLLIGSTYYTVNIVDSTHFKLHTTDVFTNSTPGQQIAIASVRSADIYIRFNDVTNAYFGGIGSNTYGILKLSTGSVYGWGYNGKCQLGLGPSTVDRIQPTYIPVSNVSSVWTGLDYAVHIVDTSYKLYGAGDNTLGKVGCGSNSSIISSFTKFNTSTLTDSAIADPANYEVYRFFSTGNNTRFCLFRSRPNAFSSYTYKLTGWGDASYLQLGITDDNAFYIKPQSVSIKNDETVLDIQTSNIYDNEVMTLLLQRESSVDYGSLHVCGRMRYNFNSYPSGETVPYFTKVKNV